MKSAVTGLAIAALTASSMVSAAPAAVTAEAYLKPAGVQTAASVQVMDALELETTRAGFAPLAVALGIAGFDIALMGFFYGVYVPYYAEQEASYQFNID